MSSGDPRGKSWISGSYLSPNTCKYLSGDRDIEFIIYSHDPSSSLDSDPESEASTSQQSPTDSIEVNLSDSELNIGTISNILQICDIPSKDIPLDHELREDMLTFLNSCIEEEVTKLQSKPKNE